MNCEMFNCISAPFQKLKSSNFVCKLSSEVDGLISQVPFEYVQQRCVAVGINVKQAYTTLMQDVLDNVKRYEAPSSPRQVEEISGTLVSDVVKTNSRTVEEVGSDTGDRTLEHIDGVIMDFEGNTELEPPSSDKGNIEDGDLDDSNKPADAKSDNVTPRPSVDTTISTKSEDGDLDGEDIYYDDSPLTIHNDSNDTFESEDMVMTTDCPTKESMSPAMSEEDESCVVVDLDEALSSPENKGEPFYCKKYSGRALLSYLNSAQEKKQNKAVSGEVDKLNQDSCENEWEMI